MYTVHDHTYIVHYMYMYAYKVAFLGSVRADSTCPRKLLVTAGFSSHRNWQIVKNLCQGLAFISPSLITGLEACHTLCSTRSNRNDQEEKVKGVGWGTMVESGCWGEGGGLQEE